MELVIEMPDFFIFTTARRRFAIKYDADGVLQSAFPMSTGDFAGPVLESAPLKLAPEQQVSPFVSGVTPKGLIKLGFSDSLITSSDKFADPLKAAVRKLSEVVMESEDGTEAQYQVFEAIEINLSSTESEQFVPIQVDWSLKSFNGQEAEIQMDLDSIRQQNIDTEVYDNVSITFNDAAGNFVTDNGKGINFGETVSFSLKPLVKQSKVDAIETLANLWLALILIATVISITLAVFQGSLVSTWMLINTLQLIAHVPLIANRLPSNAHYFLLNFLSVVRLNVELVNSQLDTLSSQLSE